MKYALPLRTPPAWILTLSLVASSTALSAPDRAYPGADWDQRSPEEVGLSSAGLRAVAEFVGGRGCVVRHGRLVFSWGDIAKRSDVASACKPWFTHFLLVAMEQKKISGVDEKVARWKPELKDLNADLGHKDREITWRHLANQTSCYGVREAPGEAYDYNDFNIALFFDALFLGVYDTSWEDVDRTVLRPLLTEPLGCQDAPTLMAFGTGNRPGRVAVSPRDFARFGLLYLRDGQWRDRQLIRPEHVQLVTTHPLPNSVPRTEGKDAEMLPEQRSIGGGKNQTDHMGSYSFAWWTNGVDREGLRHWPDVPDNAFGCFGHGGLRAMVILPDQDLIISWNDSSVNSRERENQALRLLRDSVVDPGQSKAAGRPGSAR